MQTHSWGKPREVTAQVKYMMKQYNLNDDWYE